MKTIAESNIKHVKTHIVVAGAYYSLHEDKLESFILKGMETYNMRKVMVSIMDRSRENLITKEKMISYCKGEMLEKESVNDDLDILFEAIGLGKKPTDQVEIYFFPKLTQQELKLVEKKDKKYMNTFGTHLSADVSKADMEASESNSKFVHGYGGRTTFTIENSLKRKFPS